MSPEYLKKEFHYLYFLLIDLASNILGRESINIFNPWLFSFTSIWYYVFNMMDNMEFGNGLDGSVLYGIYFNDQEISTLRDALESYDKSLQKTIDRWSNPVFDVGIGLVNQKDLDSHRDRSLRALYPEIKKREVIKKLLSKV